MNSLASAKVARWLSAAALVSVGLVFPSCADFSSEEGDDDDDAQRVMTSASGLTSTKLPSLDTTGTTGMKPQSKVWTHGGAWWAVLPDKDGYPYVWKTAKNAQSNLWSVTKGTTRLSSVTGSQADVKVKGEEAHVLLYSGATTQFVTLTYDQGSYAISQATNIPLRKLTTDAGETATIDIDSNNRMWLAAAEPSLDTTTPNTRVVKVRYSDPPYTMWTSPSAIAKGLSPDDICAVVAIPGLNAIGVMWSNQNAKQFGFRMHKDAALPATWEAQETIDSQKDANGEIIGKGVGDDHLNMKAAPDGTLYVAAKTSYQDGGDKTQNKIVLIVRNKNGGTLPWTIHPVDTKGTRGIAMLNANASRITVVYTSHESKGIILAKTSATSTIEFSAATALLGGTTYNYNDVTSTKANSDSFVVVAKRYLLGAGGTSVKKGSKGVLVTH